MDSVPATPSPTISAVSADAASGAAVRSPESSETPEERHGPVKRDGVDAANLYADAFVLFDQLTDAEKAMIRKPSEEVDADQAAKLFEKIQAIMALLRAAAKADYCDWGTGEITFDTPLTHVSKAQQLGSLALWAAAYRFSTDPAGAIDDLSARARLGHYLSDTLIGVLVAGSFQGPANDLLRDHLGFLDAAATSKALEFVAGSTLDSDLTRAMDGERKFADSWWTRLERMDPLERGQAILNAGSTSAGGRDLWDGAKELATGLLYSRQRIADEIALVRTVHKTSADAMRLPEAEFQNWWKGVATEVKDTSTLARLVLPSVDGVQKTMQRLRVERALLTAGADVLQNGPAQVGRHRDPATGNPLQYVPTATGFELRSPYLAKGKPVTMAFTRR